MERAMAPATTGGDTPPQLPLPVNLAYYPGGVPPGGIVGTIILRGFRVHGSYWDPSRTNEHTCFDTIVEKLYEGDPMLESAP
jgi:hypothetical protein